jgi:Spy/CpxP family protein refolding chaperone
MPSGRAPAACESEPAAAAPVNDATTSNVYGPAKLVADALSKVCLSDDQRAKVEQLGNDVAPKDKEVADAEHAFVKDLADQFKSGSIDDADLKAEIDALVKAHEDASPVLRKALEGLHGILDAGQRATFVDALEGRMKELRDASGGWLNDMTKDLGLSDDQKQRLEDVMGKAQPQVAKERDGATALFDAFKGNDFSVESIAPESQIGSRVRARAEGMVTLAKEIAGILTPEQRAKLVDEMEAKAGAAGGGEETGQTQQDVVVRHGRYRAGAVGGWGGGFYGRSARYTSVRTGYVAGYPFIGGYGPGIW